MDKQKRNLQKQPATPVLALVIGAVLLIAAALFFVFGSSHASGTPKLQVDQSKIDFGDVKLDTSETFAIKVVNTGDGVLTFTETPYIEVLEGC